MENEILIEKHTKKSWFKSGILGIFMGLAVIIPGVSGAQIAILFKLYDKLTFAISNILKKFKLMFLFLLPIILGMVVGFVAGFFAVKELLAIATFAVVAFFAGMMLGGTPVYIKEIKQSKQNWFKIFLLILGLIIPISISLIAIHTNLDFGSAISETGTEWWIYIVAVPVGFIVAITQIIPGLSATSTLLSIGLFNPLIESVSLTFWKANPTVLAVYVLLAVGFILGLFFLSKLINKVIEKYKSHFYYLALGLSLSSIASMFYNPEIVEYYNLWSVSGINYLELGIGISLFCLGFVAIFAIFSFSERKNKTSHEEKTSKEA